MPSTVHRPPSTVHRPPSTVWWLAALSVPAALIAIGLTEREARTAPVADVLLQESVTWSRTGAKPVLSIDAAPKMPVTVRYRVLLAELEYTWEEAADLDATGHAELALTVPPEAFLHPAAADYLTDLSVKVDLDGHLVSAPLAALAWPAGEGGPALLWAGAERDVQAPNGVLRPELRAGLGPHVRLMPDVSDLAKPRERAADPQDTGVTP